MNSVRLVVEAKLSIPLLFKELKMVYSGEIWHTSSPVQFQLPAVKTMLMSMVPSSRRFPRVTLEPLVSCLGTKFSFVWFKFKLAPGWEKVKHYHEVVGSVVQWLLDITGIKMRVEKKRPQPGGSLHTLLTVLMSLIDFYRGEVIIANSGTNLWLYPCICQRPIPLLFVSHTS